MAAASRSTAASSSALGRGDRHAGVSGAVLGLRGEVERDDARRRRRASAITSSSLGPGDAVDPDRPDDLALGLLHVGVARARRSRRPAATVAVPKASAAIAWAPPIR